MGKFKLITVILIIFLTIATQYSKVYSLTNTENEAIINFLKEADKVKW